MMSYNNVNECRDRGGKVTMDTYKQRFHRVDVFLGRARSLFVGVIQLLTSTEISVNHVRCLNFATSTGLRTWQLGSSCGYHPAEPAGLTAYRSSTCTHFPSWPSAPSYRASGKEHPP